MRPTVRLAAALLLVAAPFATPLAAAEPPAAPRSPAAPKTPAEPAAPAPPEMLPVYDTTSVGALAVEAASRAAADSSRRLLVNFGTNDCAPCRTFNDAVYEEPFQTAFFAQFVPVFVDVSPGSPNRDLLTRYGIDSSKGLPAVVLSDESLRVAEATKEGELAAAGAKGKDAVQEWLLKRFKKDAAP